MWLYYRLTNTAALMGAAGGGGGTAGQPVGILLAITKAS